MRIHKSNVLTVLLLLAFLASACAPSATPTPTPTETSLPAPTQAPSPTTEPAASTEELAALQANAWQWVSFTNPVEQFEVEEPASYTLTFNQDGTLNIVADCNNAVASYTADGSSLAIEVGPMTLAACPPESRSDTFVEYLGFAALYFFEDGNLYIDLFADGGTMEFAPADADAGAADLTASAWQWTAFTSPVEQYEIVDPASYTLTFNQDGSLNIVADCNNAVASYTADGSSLAIEVGPMTLAACPPESRSDQFIQYLGAAAIYFFEDGNLYIDLFADGGTMEFTPATENQPGMEGALPAEVVAQLDAFLQSQVYTEGGNPVLAAPGLVLLVDTPDGRYLNAAGVANLEDGTAMQVDDILQIGSNTKSMTIVLLMQLVEEGQLSLDDSLSQWLPEQAALLPNGDQITIRQMAQHTAGLWDYGDDIIGGGVSDPVKLEQGYTPEELVQYAADNGSPYFAPGEEGQWKYSNTGYILLGMIIEKITGEKLGDLMQMRIFEPLGMASAVLIEGVPQEGETTTHGYWWENGERIDTTNWNASQGWAAGAVAMTAADMSTYAQALAAGEFFRNPDTLVEMLEFDPNAKFVVGFPYGLGLGDFTGDGAYWGHAGQTLGFQSLWFTNPAQGIRVVGLSNSAAYEAYAFLNVIHILEGDGALPISPITLLPVGDLVSTTWQWRQFNTPESIVDIDETAGLQLVLSKDGFATVKSADCGPAFGNYTSGGIGSISLDIDASSLTCEADSLAGQFVQYLDQAASWRFMNGGLIIELPADAGTLVFDYKPPE